MNTVEMGFNAFALPPVFTSALTETYWHCVGVIAALCEPYDELKCRFHTGTVTEVAVISAKGSNFIVHLPYAFS